MTANWIAPTEDFACAKADHRLEPACEAARDQLYRLILDEIDNPATRLEWHWKLNNVPAVIGVALLTRGEAPGVPIRQAQ